MDITWVPSPNFNDRPQESEIRYIILHYTALPDAKTSLTWLCDPKKKVSSHYLICRTGKIYQLVKDEKRAWHAGVSVWENDENLNHTSLGIELDNNGHEPFSHAQIHALLDLLRFLCHKHRISPKNILGHQDIAPVRKMDPGPYFPWGLLYAYGFAGARLLES